MLRHSIDILLAADREGKVMHADVFSMVTGFAEPRFDLHEDDDHVDRIRKPHKRTRFAVGLDKTQGRKSFQIKCSRDSQIAYDQSQMAELRLQVGLPIR